MLNWHETMGKVGEWFWRFLAAVMLFAAGLAMWIFYQLSPPPPLVTRAAFEAAEKAGARQNAKGAIVPAAGAAVPIVPAAPAEPPAAPAPKEPLVNPEKLKFSDSIAIPVPQRK